jgi:AAA domain
VSAGASFLGRRVVSPGASIYAALEGRSNLKARIAAAKSAAGLSIFEPCGLYVWLDGLDILRPASVDAFIRAAVAVKPVDVLFDTWGQAFTGDENSAQDVGRGLRALQRIQREVDCAVGVVHHTNAGATRERGSTAFRAGLDTMILLVVADDALALSCEKQRDAEPFAEIPIRLTPVPGSGAQVVRLAADVLPATDLTVGQAKALARLAGSFSQGASSSEWRATLPEIPERSFYRITAELVRRGFVLSDGNGRHVRYRPAPGVTATLPTSLPR